METNETTILWDNLIKHRLENNELKSRTCKIFSRKARISRKDSNKSCCCGRFRRTHSFDGESLQEGAEKGNNHNWKPPIEFKPNQSIHVPVTIFGTLKPTNCKFIRLDAQSDVKVVYDLLVDDCGGEDHKPALILSVYGGAKYYIMAEKLEKKIVRGIIDAATAANAWIFTTGVNNGVSKLVGEGILHHRLLRNDSNKVKCIGLTMWGTVSENTRLELKRATDLYPDKLIHRQVPHKDQDVKETIEKNHTHCILFHNGSFNEYLSDSHRHDLVTQARKDNPHGCYAVTIIIEGGENTLEVLEHDLVERRPIVLIQGSGRFADVLASLMEQTSHSKNEEKYIPTAEDIKDAFYQFFPNPHELNISSKTERIQSILQKKNRHLLNVFSLDRDDEDVAKTIFKAIFAVKTTPDELEHANKIEGERQEQKQGRRQEEDRLVDLALKWNYVDGVLPILQSRQDALRKEGSESDEKEIKRYKELFTISLEQNRPTFVEYILASGFDPCTLLGIHNTEQREKILTKLYNDTHLQMDKSDAERVETLFGNSSITRMKKLDEKLNKFVGSFIAPIYRSEDAFTKRVYIDMRNHLCTFARVGTCTCCTFNEEEEDDSATRLNNNNDEVSYSKEELLRDLFLWSIFMDMPEMGKVILIHLPSRICAALIASAIFKRYAKASTIGDYEEKFQNQALEFETYAGIFIDKCYEYNQRLACELLLRQMPLFGNVTCMQVAISSECGKLVGTYCFDQTLSQVWYYKLSIENHQKYAKLFQLLAILTFGLLAPAIISYRDEEIKREDEQLSSAGIKCYIDQKDFQANRYRKYWLQLKYFHESPMIKMSYHFISYIWFLLVFSYMMLYHLDSPATFTVPHWTEIYVIITVSTMLCEELRKLSHRHETRMLERERWGSSGSILLTFATKIFYILPYFLPYFFFYLGLIFRYKAFNDDILTTARIIWAFDLELWYIKSLQFVVVHKSVGPKLFMLKNMLKDLAAFVYMIFIAIVAYGVVSRALILYKQVPFTSDGIFEEIFYVPYWFIYGVVSDKDLLDEKIKNDTQSVVAEAKATHVLLAFHMLFINILILNLLIAVFTHTIDKVQENTEFYWRCQRYAFVREYFECPPLAYPPLILLAHIVLIFLGIQRKCCPKLCHNKVGDGDHTSKAKGLIPIFKMIPVKKDEQNQRWNAFENAATHSFARSVVEKNKNKDVLTTDESHSKNTISTIESDVVKPISDQKEMIANLNKEISTMKSVLNENQKTITEMNQSLQWIMNAMGRMKMNSSDEQPPNLKLLTVGGDASESVQTTTNSDQ